MPTRHYGETILFCGGMLLLFAVVVGLGVAIAPEANPDRPCHDEQLRWSSSCSHPGHTLTRDEHDLERFLCLCPRTEDSP